MITPGRHTLLLGVVLMGMAVPTARAAPPDVARKFAVGLGYPFLSVKYGLSRRAAVEIRGAAGSGIGILSARGYYHALRATRLIGFAGGEVGYTAFDAAGISGKGYVAMPFVGGEFFLSNRFSVALDLGPAYIRLRSSEGGRDYTVSGVEWVTNASLHWYFSSVWR